MTRVEPGHYINEADGFSVWRTTERSVKNNYKPAAFWCFRILSDAPGSCSKGFGSKREAIHAAQFAITLQNG